MPTLTKPIANGPLIAVHQHNKATLEIVDGWRVAVRYPNAPANNANVAVDLSHWITYEVNGPETTSALQTFCGQGVALRHIHPFDGTQIYRLSPTRSILFRGKPATTPLPGIDVTAGWASIALIGPDAEMIVSKITAVDMRKETLPPGTCCQGPIFGVNTLFGRFDNRYEMHICTDMTEFFWEVLTDAGKEFNLQPAGLEYYRKVAP